MSIGYLGYLCSQLYTGFVADRFGRKPTMLLSMALCPSIMFLVAYFNEYDVAVYIAGRFFVLFFIGYHHIS